MATTSDRLTCARNLAEAVNGQPENVADALPQLSEILASETDAEVITEAVVALGFAGDPRAVQLILDHVRVDHPDAGVRLAVARALPGGFERDNPIRDAVIEALITLTADENWEVRDWACLGLGLVDAESPEARDALAARLTDLEGDIRHEALWALALTGDSRALAVLQERLAGGLEGPGLYLHDLRAAVELADPTLHPMLLQLGQEWEGDDDEFTPLLALATIRSRPEARAQALMVERELVARVNILLATQGLTAKTVGEYPRTELTFHSIEDKTPPTLTDPIWRDEHSWDYPIEQMAQSYVLTYANETEER
jgi:HEAT repeat protein